MEKTDINKVVNVVGNAKDTEELLELFFIRRIFRAFLNRCFN